MLLLLSLGLLAGVLALGLSDGSAHDLGYAAESRSARRSAAAAALSGR